MECVGSYGNYDDGTDSKTLGLEGHPVVTGRDFPLGEGRFNSIAFTSGLDADTPQDVLVHLFQQLDTDLA